MFAGTDRQPCNISQIVGEIWSYLELLEKKEKQKVLKINVKMDGLV